MNWSQLIDKKTHLKTNFPVTNLLADIIKPHNPFNLISYQKIKFKWIGNGRADSPRQTVEMEMDGGVDALPRRTRRRRG